MQVGLRTCQREYTLRRSIIWEKINLLIVYYDSAEPLTSFLSKRPFRSKRAMAALNLRMKVSTGGIGEGFGTTSGHRASRLRISYRAFWIAKSSLNSLSIACIFFSNSPSVSLGEMSNSKDSTLSLMNRPSPRLNDSRQSSTCRTRMSSNFSFSLKTVP